MTIDAIPEAPPIDGYTKLYDYDGSGNLIYEGWARADQNASTVRGQTTQVWVIRKNTYNGSNQLTMQQWANGDTTDLSAWSARTTLTYA